MKVLQSSTPSFLSCSLALLLPLLLLLLSKTLSSLSQVSILGVFGKNGKKNKGNGFYNGISLLTSSLCLLGVGKWKEKGKKVVYNVFLTSNKGETPILTNCSPHP